MEGLFIGNDIIDIHSLSQHPRSGQPRFRNKTLSKSEIKWLLTSTNPAFDIWKLWALKESAYKCYFQQTRHRFFSPKKFICQWEVDIPASEYDLAQVSTPSGIFFAKLYQKEHYLHALCSNSWEHLNRVIFQVFNIQSLNANDLSCQLRAQALLMIAQQMNFLPEDLTWDDVLGFPQLMHGGQRLPYRVSLSHHGVWGAVGCSEEIEGINTGTNSV